MTDNDDQSQPRREPLTQRNFQSVVDKKIADAVSEGQFSALEGSGKPLAYDDESHVPEEDRLAFRLLKSNGYTPAWIELRREIAAERQALDGWLANVRARWPDLDATTRSATRAEARSRLMAMQRKVLNFNLTSPAAVHVEGVRVEWELRQLEKAE